MTTEQIRKQIHITSYFIGRRGVVIAYSSDQTNSHIPNKHYTHPPLQTLQALERIGSITKFDANPIRVWWETPKGTSIDCGWDEFHSTFTLSQYEAITLVVRHEYEQSLKNDMNLLEIDKTLEALKH